GVGLCVGSCGALDEPGARYVSLTGFDWAWPENYSIEASDESIFGEVKRVTQHVAWLEVRGSIDLSAGQWAIDSRVFPSRTFKWELGAAPESEDCGVEAWTHWIPPNGGAWGVSSEKLLLDVSGECSFEVTLRAVEDPFGKEWTALDWIRIRHACSEDSDCPVLEGSPEAVCLSGACSYDEACFPPEWRLKAGACGSARSGRDLRRSTSG